RLEPQHAVGGRQLEQAASGAVRHADDGRRFAAVQEEVLHRVRQEAELAMSAEHSAKSFEALDRNGFVEGPALGAADEGDGGGRDYGDDFVTVEPLGLWGNEVEGLGGHCCPCFGKSASYPHAALLAASTHRFVPCHFGLLAPR